MDNQNKIRIFFVKRKRVIILQSFDNSYLVRYVATLKESSVSKDLVKSKLVDNTPKKKKVNNQLKIKFKK